VKPVDISTLLEAIAASGGTQFAAPDAADLRSHTD
jgi:hypothetical protein